MREDKYKRTDLEPFECDLGSLTPKAMTDNTIDPQELEHALKSCSDYIVRALQHTPTDQDTIDKTQLIIKAARLYLASQSKAQGDVEALIAEPLKKLQEGMTQDLMAAYKRGIEDGVRAALASKPQEVDDADRREALEELFDGNVPKHVGQKAKMANAFWKHQDTIRSALTQAPQQNGWNFNMDEAPTGPNIIILREDNSVRANCYRLRNGLFNEPHGNTMNDVKAWQPLPTPPAKDKQ